MLDRRQEVLKSFFLAKNKRLKFPGPPMVKFCTPTAGTQVHSQVQGTKGPTSHVVLPKVSKTAKKQVKNPQINPPTPKAKEYNIKFV